MSAKHRQLIFLNLIAAILLAAGACNSKTDHDEEEIVVTPAIVAVKNFYLQKNDSVMAKLDSVAFSIDLASGAIFNADSLPVGTDISKLVPSITFANTMTKAQLSFFKDGELTTVDYLTNPNDTIDFSSPVTLDVTAQNGLNSFSYVIKVNVHKINPDTIIWDRLSESKLPALSSRPRTQKTVVKDKTVYCLIWEEDDTFTLATTSDLNSGQWETDVFSPGFFPDPATLTATSENFYITSQDGELFESPDMVTWTSTGREWVNILGAYGNSVLGLKSFNSKFYHTMYPKFEGFEETEADPSFPIFNSTPLGVAESKWADKPIAFLAGGLAKGGNVSSDVWAYDGNKWAVINSSSLPALEYPMMARYVVFRDTQQLFTQREFDVWLLFGGILDDGQFNSTVYFSYDNGVNWMKAPEGMQLPEKFPQLGGADLVVDYSTLSADLAEAWTPTETGVKSRASYSIEGFEISWECPYLYIIGGHLPYPDNSLNTTIYRGVLQKLTFVPDI
ncbi:MAG: hypothetical protein J1D77_09005 [Muribaculaceae bacterium]|nr:hypothetical protein [Muribaculaceae bacterium]